MHLLPPVEVFAMEPASMGPRFVNRGCVRMPEAVATVLDASMGPRFVNRGCDAAPPPESSAWRWLQWGRGLLTADAAYDQMVEIMQLLLQWGRGLLTADA